MRLVLSLALAMAAAGCSHKQVKLAPPTPPMPPGVSWGVPNGVPPAATSATAKSRPPARTRTVTTYPTPPTDRSLPVGNYNPDPKVGEIWETGIASFYGPREQGRDTASGQAFDYRKMTAAHRLLPLGTVVRVTDLKTNEAVNVTINDRGPFWPNRLLDLSWGAAQKIGDDGLDRVRIEIVKLPDPVPVGVYTVQVGWFTDSDELKQCKREMESQLNDPVIAFGSDEGRWLRYNKKTLLDMATATAIVRSLRQQHYPAYLVRLN